MLKPTLPVGAPVKLQVPALVVFPVEPLAKLVTPLPLTGAMGPEVLNVILLPLISKLLALLARIPTAPAAWTSST